MVSLYLFYVGGNAGKSNIEVHDVQFAAVANVEDAYPLLREAWFGDKDKIHLDGYTTVTWVDGYDITLTSTPSSQAERLYFVNMGGYVADSLAEVHAFDLFVARNAEEAKEKAKKTLLCGMAQQHKDNLKDVDNCLVLSAIGGYHVHLSPNPNGTPAKPLWQGYRPIGIPAPL